MDFFECICLLGSFFYALIESFINFLTPTSWRYKDVSSDTVLITGAASGIGRLLSYEFAKLGCKLILWDIDKNGLDVTVKECSQLGAEVSCNVVNLADADDIKRNVEIVKKIDEKVDILVNNAGIVSGKTFLDTPDEKIDLTMKVNTMAHFWLLKGFLPRMLETNHGHVVTVASLAGKLGSPGLVDYCASKFAAVGIDAALRCEVYKEKKDGVHTTCVCPCFISTGMFAGIENSFLTRYVVPILSPEYVVSKMMDAILINQQMLLLPKFSYFLAMMEPILPTRAALPILKLAGALNSMDSFLGRAKSE